MEKETLEEAAERLTETAYQNEEWEKGRLKRMGYYQGLINGAKWQQEQMYSEVDLKEAFKVNYTPLSATNIGDFDKDWNKWFEQFKKK